MKSNLLISFIAVMTTNFFPQFIPAISYIIITKLKEI